MSEVVPYLILFGLFILGCFVGWLLNDQLGGRRVHRPVRHHSADSEYIVLWYDGEPAAFTVEAIATAKDRAVKLNLK